MIASESVIFAIQAGIKLGNKINRVLIDSTRERALVLPLGDLFANVPEIDAFNYFQVKKSELVSPGGPYYGFNDEDLVKAYRTILSIREEVGDIDGIGKTAEEIVINLHRFEQVKAGFGSRPAVQRILGVVVEIGIDYFVANPDRLEGDSDGKKILAAFIKELDEIEFSEATPKTLISDVMLASLRTLNQNATLIDDDERTTALIAGITQSLIEDYEKLTSPSARDQRGELIRRIATSVIKGGAGAFNENIDLFLRDDPKAKTLVSSTLSQVIAGLESKADLFSNESIELIYKSALTAVGEHPDLFTSDQLLQDLIGNTVRALSAGNPKTIFGPETVSAIVQGGIQAVAENVDVLIDSEDPQTELLANIVRSVAHGLSNTLASGGTVKDLLSKKQRIGMMRIVFNEVAKNPEHLLAGMDDDTRKSALAQVIGSVARALGEDPGKLVTGEGVLELLKTTLHTAVLNADKLLKLDSQSVGTNIVFKVLQQISTAVLEHSDPRQLVSRGVFLMIVEKALPVVSANLDGIVDGGDDQIKAVISKVLDLANDTLQNRVNGANLPDLTEEFLKRVLRGELNLEEEVATLNAATEILDAA